MYLREITNDVCYLAQPNKGYHNKVATVTEDAASSCPLSQPWMWLLMAFSPSFNSQPFFKKQFKQKARFHFSSNNCDKKTGNRLTKKNIYGDCNECGQDKIKEME